MRDAVTFEALGIPTIVLVNDVFEPIAHATATLLRLPEDYVAKNVVWLPHPTSLLSAAAAAALVDERIEIIKSALVSDAAPTAAAGERSVRGENGVLETARAAVRAFAESLRADGAELVLSTFADGTLAGEVRIRDVTCADGACIMPTEALERMVDAMLRPKIAALRRVTLREVDER